MANETDSYDENEELWFLNLQEFLDDADMMINLKSPDAESIPTFLKNLESFDSTFHQHSIVQQIRNKLEVELSPIIDQCIEESIIVESDLLSPQIDTFVMNSQKFANVSQHIIDSVSEAAKHLKEIFKSDTFVFFSNSDGNKSGENIFYCDDSVCSTVDGSDYMFMSARHYKALSHEIEPSNSLHMRLQALTMLNQVPQVDLVSSESWSLTKERLVSGLCDENEDIVIEVLKLISKLFFSGSSRVVNEFLFILIQNLIEYFNDNTSHMISIETGLDLGDKRNILLLRKFRLLNQIIIELPVHWLRYSETVIENIGEMLVELLSITPTPITETFGKYLMTPLHFFSLLDPQATWYQNWMHSFYGRSNLLNSIRSNIKFVKNILSNFLITAKNFNNIKEIFQENEEYINYDNGDIHYTYFIHIVHIMTTLLFYKEGTLMFNFESNNGFVVSINELVEKFIKVLKIVSNATVSIEAGFNPSTMLVNLIKNLSCNESSSCKRIICNQGVCDLVFEPILNIKPDISRNLFCALAEIIIVIAECDSGRKIILKMNNVIVPRLIALIDRFKLPQDSKAFMLLLRLISKIFNTLDGIFSISDSLFFVELYNNFLKRQAHSNEKDSIVKYTKLSKEELKLAQCLLSFSITPKGFNCLESSGALGTIFFIEEPYREKYLFSSFVNFVVASHGGVVALKEGGFFTSLLHNTWFHLEGCSNDYTKTIMSDISEDLSDKTSNEFYNSIVMLFSSFPAVKYLLIDEYNERSNLKKMESFQDLITCTIIHEEQSLLLHFEQTHFFILNIIAAIITCLDSMIHIEIKFDLCKKLLYLQEQCKYDEEYIIDQCLLKRNEVLVRLLLLGGESERLIPPDTIEKDDDGFCLPIFSQLPLPEIYELSSHIILSNRTNKRPLSSFLSEFKGYDFSSNELSNIYEKAVDVFFSEITLGDIQENLELGSFLTLVVNIQERDLLCCMPEGESANMDTIIKLKAEDNYAIDLIANYGFRLRLLTSKSEAVSDLNELLCRATKLLYAESSNDQRFCGFDWFTSIIFLIFRGDIDAAWKFLKTFFYLKSSSYVWMKRLDGKPLKEKFNLHPVYTKICHYIEMLLEKELPYVYSAFFMADYPVSSVCLLWFRQNFLNYLDWPEIVCYITGSIVMKLDYPIYFCLAIFNHLQPDIILHRQTGNLVKYLRSCTLSKFRVANYIDFIKSLSKRYSFFILKDLSDL
ncbi:protein broad-minded isoform X2 [Hydra vulgaris]|uniref:Protein broad-minded isoform X2 n=1 Tax=Hydra vulgaris TaxID=6087 RepID=A0ABM4BKG5_HYDVU